MYVNPTSCQTDQFAPKNGNITLIPNMTSWYKGTSAERNFTGWPYGQEKYRLPSMSL